MKKSYKIIYFVLFALLFYSACILFKTNTENATTIENPNAPTPEFIALLKSKIKYERPRGKRYWVTHNFRGIDFNGFDKISKENVHTTYKEVFNLGEHDSLGYDGTSEANSAFPEQSYYKHYHKGYEVTTDNYIMNFIDSNFISGHGDLHIGIDVDTAIQITQEKALELAYAAVPAEEYAWEVGNRDPKADFEAVEEVRNGYVQLYIRGNRLVYGFNIEVRKPKFDFRLVEIDAITGKVITNRVNMLFNNSNF